MRKYTIYYRQPGVYDWTPQSDRWFEWSARLFLWWIRLTEHSLDCVEFKILDGDGREVKHEPVYHG